MPLSYEQIERLLGGLAAPSWEPGLDVYREHLVALNEIIVRATGGQGEGNLFYEAIIDPLDRPHPGFVGKRRNFSLFAAAGDSLLEIGVNAGHSLILALSVNPGLHYTGVDWGGHPYSAACFAYLREKFGDRIELIQGDSRDVLPDLLRSRRRNFDLFHIDGGHEFDAAYADLSNTLDLAREGSLILFDDTDQPKLEAICDYFVISGWVGRVGLGRIWDAGSQTLLRVQRRR